MELLFSNITNIGNAIGWTLIHFLWQGTLLFLGYWSITRLFLKNKINPQYWIGIVFISLCLIIPIREFFVQLDTTNSHYTLIEQASFAFSEISSAGLLNPTDLFVSLIQKIIPYLVVIWAVSVFLISSHLFKSWLSLVKISKEPSAPIPEFLNNKLESAAKTLKLRFKPIISISKKIDIPATFGYFKPIVLIPLSLINKIPDEQMEAILLHEMCHIKRADFLHNIIQLLVETLFFYHPLTKWISRDVRTIREQCCDDLVLELKTNPLTYAKALTNIATIYNRNESANLNIQIAASDGELFNRIKILMLNKRPKSSMTNIVVGLFFSAITLIVFNNIINDNNSGLSFDNSSSGSVYEVDKQNNRPEYTAPNVYQFLTNTSDKPEQAQENTVNKQRTNPSIVSKNTNQEATQTRQKALTNDDINRQELDRQTSTIVPAALGTQNQIEKSTTTALYETTDNTINQLLPTPTEQPLNSTNTVDDQKAFTNTNAPAVVEQQDSVADNRKNYPKVIKRVNPKFGLYEQLSGAEGTVILSFNIDDNGKVKKISIDKRSKLKILDSISRQALRRWQFDPATINASNINLRYQQIFRFSLDKKAKECKGSVTGTRINSKQLCNKK